MRQSEHLKIINDWLSDGAKEPLDLDFKPLDWWSKLLFEAGFNTIRSNSLNLCNKGGNDWDTNGWQVDFWWYIHKDKVKYCFYGSLFYGEFKLSKS
jgi:hypothetical protein